MVLISIGGRMWFKLLIGFIIGNILAVMAELPMLGWEHGLCVAITMVVCLICIEIGVEMLD